MSEKKPTTIPEYKKWLLTHHKVEITERTIAYYESVITKMRQTFETSDFWISVKNDFNEVDARYRLKQDYPLWVAEKFPKLILKPFDSFLLKTFRKNFPRIPE